MKGIYQVRPGITAEDSTNENVLLISSKADALRAQTEEHYNGLKDNPLHDEAYMEILKRGLKLKKSSAIFSEEERDFFDKIDSAEKEARELFSSLAREKDRLDGAVQAESMYADTFRPEGETLPELLEQNEKDQGAVMTIIGTLMETRSIATGIGWERYEALLHKNYRRITSEVRAIIKELKAVTFVEKETMTLEFPKALHIQFETEDYEANTLMVLPAEEISKDALDEILKPLLYHHRKALEASEYSTSFIETLINSKSKEVAKTAELSIDEDLFSSIFTTSVETYSYPADKVSNQLTKLQDGVERPLALESQRDKKKGKEITTLVTLDFDELSEGESGIKKLKALDNIDRELLNAVFSVWESASANGEVVNGEAVTTLQTLYRLITKNPNSRLDSDKEEELVNRLMKLTSANISIHAEQEFEYYPLLEKEKQRLERRGNLIAVVVDRATINGNVVYNAVRILRLDRLPLYIYAKAKNQIISVPLKKLDTKVRNKTNETIAIEGYLIRRIEAIPRLSNEILISTLLEEVGIYEKDYKHFNKKRSDVVKKVDELLAGYVSTGYIKKYEFQAGKRMKYHKVILHK